MLCSHTPEPTGQALSCQVPKGHQNHPCFYYEAHKLYARMHLPVAPNCNVECNYCNRKYDCVNESRPGVCSEILSPEEALSRYLTVRDKIDNLSVIGIAGPGDALANWHHTRKTIELIKQHDADINFCLSTNGLLLPEYAPQIVGLGVGYVTVTINSLNPAVGQQIYRYVNYHGKRYTGTEAAAILQNSQLTGIRYLTDHGIVVKVNTVMIAGINDQHLPDLTRQIRDLGVSICNIMPLIPVRGSTFAHLPSTSMRDLQLVRQACEENLPQMYHCRQCRADAVGLLGEENIVKGNLKTGDYPGRRLNNAG